VRIALVRHHEQGVNTRQLRMIQRRAGVLPHLGLGYLHAHLQRGGHHVVTLDSQAQRLSDDALAAALRTFGPDLVGVTTTTPGLAGALVACRLGKGAGARVILGGPHTEVFAEENLVHEDVDFVGVGEGTSIMTGLAAALDAGDERPELPGLVSRWHYGGMAPYRALEDLAWPDRLSIPLNRYRTIMARRPFATVMSSRGCPFKCSFCFKHAADQRSTFRSPRDLVAEMTYLVRNHGVREIMFYDDVFTMRRKRVFAICEEIRRERLRVRWEAPTRVDLVDPALLRAMAAAGCIRLRFGIESGSPELLVRMKKQADLNRIHTAVKVAADAGIETFAYFIVGYLGETQGQYRQTLDLARALPLNYASFYTATPLPGTALFREAVEAGVVDAGYWHRYVRDPNIERVPFMVPHADRLARDAYAAFYFRRAAVKSIMRRVREPRAALDILTGLGALACSRLNAERDI